jgi:hypothetical protein
MVIPLPIRSGGPGPGYVLLIFVPFLVRASPYQGGAMARLLHIYHLESKLLTTKLFQLQHSESHHSSSWGLIA